jgi:hypothetical protein
MAGEARRRQHLGKLTISPDAPRARLSPSTPPALGAAFSFANAIPKLRNTATQIRRDNATMANAESTVPSQGRPAMELYPCPFCAGKAVVSVRDDPKHNCHWFWVSCSICKVGLSQSQYRVEETAKTDWNDGCEQLLVNFPTRVRTLGG